MMMMMMMMMTMALRIRNSIPRARKKRRLLKNFFLSLNKSFKRFLASVALGLFLEWSQCCGVNSTHYSREQAAAGSS